MDFLKHVVLGEIRRLTKFVSLYEDEQKKLAEKIENSCFKIEKQSGQTMTTDRFIYLVRKYIEYSAGSVCQPCLNRNL